LAADTGVNLAGLHGSGPSGRITKSDVMAAASRGPAPTAGAATPAPAAGQAPAGGTRGVRREKMSRLRQRIAERLVEAQHTAAMLTTFNEADMTEVMALRKRYKESFGERHGVGLGFMSFFVKACASALMTFPRVNGYIVDGEIEFHDYVDISVAVGTPKGLVVPVLRNCESMSFADVESTIKTFAARARDGQLTIDEMTGGTFTISNGGVYGSLNSTPILNPPQSGILGMHKIMNRPMEHPDRPGELALRPMMYLALSYDHRIVDGAEAVGFLVHVKDCIEHPERMLLGV
ncbi:MAG: dihydrolipoyllysine-residue succinyltransferase, partial [Phycisphaerales bacterium]|nr:dihydrolipoyllysine-residue succinyltransferase [Phycisphaerales bacterium]